MKSERKPTPPLKRLRFAGEAAALHTLAWLVPKFPRLTIWRFGRWLGGVVYRLSPKLRGIALANLETAFGATMPAPEKQRVARASFQSVGATLLGLFWSPRLNRELLDQIVEIDGLVEATQAREKGIIFATLHYGDWELLGLATGFYGVPTTVVQEAMKNEAVEKLFARLRGRSGHRIVPSRFAATTLLKTLKRGGNIALLLDLNATRQRGGIWVNFFGLPVFSLAAVGALAVHSGAAIIPCFALPLGDGRVRLVYGPAIKYPLSGNNAADTHAITQQCLAFCEQTIRRQPEHWLWAYKRWSPRATPEPGRYPAYSRYLADIAPHHEPATH